MITALGRLRKTQNIMSKKETPILFSTPMVQAILEGRKTMTRRIVNPQPEKMNGLNTFTPIDEFLSDLKVQAKSGLKEIHTKGAGNGYSFPLCPYGKVGDVLWVRETFLKNGDFMTRGNVAYWYKASIELIPFKTFGWKWKPSIHMPKSAARVWLEITNIRVERLQDISEEDAIAEGINGAEGRMGYVDYLKNGQATFHPITSFQTLWQSINGEQSWNDNPWVWVLEFKQIEKP